jgi:high-affinity iron transporter
VLPTFVIGLREGLEAALIVGIIAAFLRKQGRTDLMRQMAVGVGAAVAICAAVGIGLDAYSRNLPQRQQEGLETVIAVLAVGMVTYMVLWMKQHSRGLKAELESMAADAIGGRGRAGLAMVAMAFLAVLREGFETAVFLVATFNESGSGVSAMVGAVLGVAVAIALGYGIYRGGVRINLSKFFRATGLVLVLVAGGLVVSALHTAHEAGWLDAGQHRMLDLSWLVQPGSVLASVLTGMLGVQPFPVLAEVVGWLLYVVPLGVYVAWPPGRAVPVARLRTALAAVAAAGLAAAALLATTAPARAGSPVTRDGDVSAQVTGRGAGELVVRTQSQQPLAAGSGSSPSGPSGPSGPAGALDTFRLRHTGSTEVGGLLLEVYTGTFAGRPGTPTTLGTARLAALNGGRLPLGVAAAGGAATVRYVDARTLSVAVEPTSRRVVRLDWTGARRVLASGSAGQVVTLARPAATARAALSAPVVEAARAAAARDLHRTDVRDGRIAGAWLTGLLGGAALLGLLLSLVRRPVVRRPVTEPTRTLVRS